LLSISSSFIFTLDVTIELAGPFLTLVAFALDVVHLATIQFIFLYFSDTDVHHYDVARPVACSTIPVRLLSFLLSSHFLLVAYLLYPHRLHINMPLAQSEPAAPSNRLPVLRSFLCLLPLPLPSSVLAFVRALTAITIAGPALQIVRSHQPENAASDLISSFHLYFRTHTQAFHLRYSA
jgi:hypothetical protein